MGELPSLTIEEKILMVLVDNLRYDEAFEVPPCLTQEGLSDIIGANRPNISRSLGSMMKKGVIRERLAHVKGQRRRKKAYMVQGSGLERAHGIREDISRLKFDGSTISEIAKGSGREVSEMFLSLTKGSAVSPGGAVDRSPFKKERAFFGRRKGIDAILRWAADPDSNIMVVWGMAGIGKTALVRKALSQARFDLISVPISSTLGGLLHQIEIALSTDLPRRKDPGDIALNITHALSGRGVLVLDDFQHADEAFQGIVKHMTGIPNRFKLLLITRSKGSFYTPKQAIEGRITEMEIEGLKKEEALELLRSRGMKLDVSDDIIGRFGGHPLALLLVSEKDRIKAYSEISDLIENEVIASLKDEELSLLRAISVPRTPVSDPMGLIRAGGLSPAALRSLLDRGILETEGDKISVHSLVKGVVNESMGPEDWKLFNSMASDMYLRDIDRIPSYIEALHHLVQADRGSEFLELLKDRGSRALDAGFLELLLVLDGINPMSLDPIGRGYIHAIRGEAYIFIGDLVKARHELDIARSISIMDRSLEAFILERIGSLLRMSGNDREAISILERAEKIFHSIDNKSSMDISREISTLNGLGLAFQALGERKKAESRFLRSIEIASSCDPFGSLPALHLNLGRYYLEDNDTCKAFTELDRGSKAAEMLGDDHTASLIFGTMGEIKAIQGKHDEAMDLFEKALSITPDPFELEDMASSYLIGHVSAKGGSDLLGRIGSLLGMRRSSEDGDLSRLYSMICRIGKERGIAISQKVHERAHDIFRDRKMHLEATKALNNLGVSLSKSGQHEKAVDIFTRTLDSTKEPRARIMTLYNLSRSLKRLGRSAEASSRIAEAKRLADQFGQTDLLALFDL